MESVLGYLLADMVSEEYGYHGGVFQHPSSLAKRAVDYLKEFMNAQDFLSVPDPIHVPAQQTW